MFYLLFLVFHKTNNVQTQEIYSVVYIIRKCLRKGLLSFILD